MRQLLVSHARVIHPRLNLRQKLFGILPRQQAAIKRPCRSRRNHIRLRRIAHAAPQSSQRDRVLHGSIHKLVRRKGSERTAHAFHYRIGFVGRPELLGLFDSGQENVVGIVGNRLRAMTRSAGSTELQPKHLLIADRHAENCFAGRVKVARPHAAFIQHILGV